MQRFEVSGMSCSGCVDAVTRAIRRIDSSASVDVDLGTGRVSVEGIATSDAIAAAIEDAGFSVEGRPPA
jgi:copper chaperone